MVTIIADHARVTTPPAGVRIPTQRNSRDNVPDTPAEVWRRMTTEAVPDYSTEDTHLCLFSVGHNLGQSFVWAKKCCGAVQLAAYRPERTSTMSDSQFAAITLGFEVGVHDARIRYGLTEVPAR